MFAYKEISIDKNVCRIFEFTLSEFGNCKMLVFVEKNEITKFWNVNLKKFYTVDSVSLLNDFATMQRSIISDKLPCIIVTTIGSIINKVNELINT